MRRICGECSVVKTDWATIFPAAPRARENNPLRAGEVASKKVWGGENDRYSLFAVHTRFDSVTWVIKDCETNDPATWGPAIIYQGGCPI